VVAALPDLLRDVEEILPGVVADRRFLHQHPELALQEYKTSAFIIDRLQQLGFDEVRTGIAGTGVVGIIHGGKPGKMVALRADMDALPIEEENDVEYRSQVPGVMHACGHDAHVSMLLGAARLLIDRKADLPGSVMFIFQPGEEGAGGAKKMIEAGIFAETKPDAVFGLHIWQDTPSGLVEVRDTVAMSGIDAFTVDIHGKGGHGAQPHTTIDPITVGSAIVNALHTVVSRSFDPVVPGVLTIGTFRAGDAANVIPASAHFAGTIRTVQPDQRAVARERFEGIVRGIAAAMGATVEIAYFNGTPATINTPAMSQIVRETGIELFGADRVVDGQMKGPSEDFSEFMQLVPGCYFFVGSRSEPKGYVWGHHHPKFDIDEEAMATGVGMLVGTAVRYLETQS
jgi:amidohydrolase